MLFWCFYVNFKHILRLFLVFLLLTLGKQILARLKLFKRKNVLRSNSRSNRRSEIFYKNYRKTTAPQSIFDKAAGLQQFFYRRLLQQLARTFSVIWLSKKKSKLNIKSFIWKLQKQPTEAFCENFTGNTYVGAFFNKVAGLLACKLIKKILQNRCFL